MEDAAQKTHHKRLKGAKADKRKLFEKKKDGKSTDRHNFKAFVTSKPGRLQRVVRRNLDRAHRKLHVPVVERKTEVDPPLVVVVMGPKGVGKSTLIKSMVKNYTRQNVSDIRGPVTVVSGKKRRVTFFECPNDVCSMLDMAKVADLVLLMIDAVFGFEMETFEFLNMMQIHGFPKVLGVLTHLDKFTTSKAMRDQKKTLKHRFWKDVYQGAKLFYLSGLINGKYPRTEVHNLALFVSRIKLRPLIWRSSHPYLLADRIEDITDPAAVSKDASCDRKLCLYGYARGTPLKQGARVHLAGAGDFFAKSVSALGDPCPLPDSGKKRALNAKETLLYAPMSDVGGVVFDKDAMYIDLKQVHFSKADTIAGGEAEKAGLLRPTDGDHDGDVKLDGKIVGSNTRGEGVQLVRELQDAGEGLGEGLESAELSLFSGSRRLKGEDVPSSAMLAHGGESSSESGEDASEESRSAGEEEEEEMAMGGEEVEEGGVSAARWREKLTQVAASRFLDRASGRVDLMDLVYGQEKNDPDDELASEEDAEELFATVNTQQSVHDRLDSSAFRLPSDALLDWNTDEVKALIRHRFFASDPLMDEGDEFGGFVDLEAVEARKARPAEFASVEEEREWNAKQKALMKEKFDSAYDVAKDGGDSDVDMDVSAGSGEEEGEEEEEEGLHHHFEQLKASVGEQEALNRTEFQGMSATMKAALQGVICGEYVRVELDGVPPEFFEHFEPRRPVVMGGLLPNEQGKGLVRCRVKQHRWFNRQLKTNDPVVVSVGWRRFQTIPVYHVQDLNERHRMIKYTPEHMHCYATFFGPIVPPNTGIIAMKFLDEQMKGFRVSLSGTVVELDHTLPLSKKLKLVGHPRKIHKHTAFIEGMFNSSLEVAKFEGAAIRSVSGIRGTIKKAAGEKGGFRATFEDKILMSDLISCTTWVPVEPKHYCNPVTNALVSNTDEWKRLRTFKEIRHDEEIPLVHRADSQYTAITRETRRFNPLKVPAKLQAALPFASKPKLKKRRATVGQFAVERKRMLKKDVTKGGRAIVVEPEERKGRRLMQLASTLRSTKLKKRKEAKLQRREVHLKKKREEDAKFEPARRMAKKRKYKMMDGKKQGPTKRARKG